MSTCTDKFRLLARQARTLAATVSDSNRADALSALAMLYDKQAADLTV